MCFYCVCVYERERKRKREKARERRRTEHGVCVSESTHSTEHTWRPEDNIVELVVFYF